MALNVPVFLTRTASAVVFAIIVMAGLLWNDYAFLVLAAVIQVLCLRDYFRLVKKITPDVIWPVGVTFIVQVVSLLWLVMVFCSLTMDVPFMHGKPLWPLLLCMPTLLFVYTALSARTTWLVALQSITGWAYIALPVMLFTCMRMQSMLLPVMLIAMIWTNDTMAYIVGSFIGKRPFSSISPKKTWEGTIGGAILTVVVAGIGCNLCGLFSFADWCALALCAAIAGTAGDLLESKLKRMADVKDSGTLMPGHGGALDRFDSLLVAVPFAYGYAYFFMPSLHWVIF